MLKRSIAPLVKLGLKSMTTEKIIEVLNLYKGVLSNVENKDEVISHCMTMIDKTKSFVSEGRIGKAFRWLGFIQGCLYSKGIYSIEEMKAHNRNDI